MSANEWRDELEQLLKESSSLLRRDEPLAGYTSFRIGGKADGLIMVKNVSGLRMVRRFCAERKLPAVILGRGTNVLISDQGLRGVVVKLSGDFNFIEVSGDRIIAGAATLLDTIAETAEARGLAGAEFLAGIPGTIGGALMTNAGAFGKSLSSILDYVETMDENGSLRVITKPELRDEYRQPVIPSSLWATKVGLQLAFGQGRPVQMVRAERWAKHPQEPSAGSFFKNPPGTPAAILIERCNLKGRAIGGAMVSERHANFIINKGGASFADVYELVQVIKATVEEKTGIELQEEVQIVPGF
jgi:UDP-N-acetylmuramate dehydrogenase